jgi:cold shock CspA family protein
MPGCGLRGDSPRSRPEISARAAKRQIELQRGHVTFMAQGFAAAEAHYKASVCGSPASDRDRRTNETASFILADHMLRAGRRDEAKRYIAMCKENATTESRYQVDLKELAVEARAGRITGRVDFITFNRGHGFIAVDGQSAHVRLNREALCSACSLTDFNRLRGHTVSFVVVQEPGGERIAKRALMLD